jgi:glycosyltransferase involved in cell wall biosynthesis
MPLPQVHLVNPLWDPNGGGDWRTVATYRLLKGAADVDVWSEYDPHLRLAREVPVKRIRPFALAFPRRGTLVFVGVYFRIGHWVRLARPARTVVIYNTLQPDRLTKNLARLRSSGCDPEVVYTSRALRCLEGGRGVVLESPIDVERFRPLQVARRTHRPFTVGRLSRDVRSKHHGEDPRLWRELAASGCAVRLMGATCLAPELSGVDGIEILPAGAEDPAMFLRSLDCFVYRTSADWFEAYGRVVLEAMASGLPIVASRNGGYVDHLHHGMNALLFDSTEEARGHVEQLRRDPAFAERLGAAARDDASRFNRVDLPARTVDVLVRRQGSTLLQLTGSHA